MINLSEISTRPPSSLDKDETQKKTRKMADKIGRLQRKMYAEGKHSILVVLQGMDAAGKDGAVRKVFGECSPSGIDVHSFKKPTDLEFAHDFLWRVHQKAPQKGHIQIFNRSHFEDVLIQRVHKWIDEERVTKRINAINAFEELLEFDNNTKVLKFYLHISKDQQKIELQERLDDPDKHWKHNPGDWKEREHWDEYRRCYEDAINRTTIPWTIVPVDERWYRDFIIAEKVLSTLEGMDIEMPKLEAE